MSYCRLCVGGKEAVRSFQASGLYGWVGGWGLTGGGFGREAEVEPVKESLHRGKGERSGWVGG